MGIWKDSSQTHARKSPFGLSGFTIPTLKLFTVIGARPQFIKAAAVSRALGPLGVEEVLVHTGQHYDAAMSDVFFDELEIPAPRWNLAVGSGGHGAQTGRMMEKLEETLLAEKPDRVLVYGDTNSTLAGALVAAKCHVPVAHVEAGLRSFNRAMPEEINRVLTDHLSDLLFCPGAHAVENLKAEGITQGVRVVGDVMADALAFARQKNQGRNTVAEGLGLAPGGYLLATVHRAENTDDPARLAGILDAFAQAGEPVVFPVHPRTRKHLTGLAPGGDIRLIDPVGYLDMAGLLAGARMALTDSGGLQKEAYWLKVPCLTLRSETEWVETVEMGWNVVTGVDTARILAAITSFRPPSAHPPLYTHGAGAADIAQALVQAHGR